MNETITLCPAQQMALDRMLRLVEVGSLITLSGGGSSGNTTVLREAHHRLGGAFLNMKELMQAMQGQHPLTLEETFHRLMMQAVTENDVVFLDDLSLLSEATGSYMYPRRGLLSAPLKTLAVYAAEAGKKLIFCGHLPCEVSGRAYYVSIPDFEVEDYAFLCRHYLGAERAAAIDWAKVHRFAPELDVHQLRGTCLWLREEETLDTDIFIEYLRSHHMSSNVDLGEVQAVDLHDLKGVDDIVQSLETNIILPLENDALAAELGLKSKRGVLLAGPPGTGKTTVGRALAHRLKSKFFLVDGTFISGTDEFYDRIQRIFDAARHNAPSILFIDDSDVIFESGTESGLYRYLLTMLDGLESESAGRVCVMLTAMDVGNLPPALMRSGRVELWLETRLPDTEARTAILRGCLHGFPTTYGKVDISHLAGLTEGLTGADLKRLVEDGKLLFAADRAQERPLRPITDYFANALTTLRANKERYLTAEARARQQHPSRPPWFDVASDGFSPDEAIVVEP